MVPTPGARAGRDNNIEFAAAGLYPPFCHDGYIIICLDFPWYFLAFPLLFLAFLVPLLCWLGFVWFVFNYLLVFF